MQANTIIPANQATQATVEARKLDPATVETLNRTLGELNSKILATANDGKYSFNMYLDLAKIPLADRIEYRDQVRAQLDDLGYFVTFDDTDDYMWQDHDRRRIYVSWPEANEPC